jgi:hypothetical protein
MIQMPTQDAFESYWSRSNWEQQPYLDPSYVADYEMRELPGLLEILG